MTEGALEDMIAIGEREIANVYRAHRGNPPLETIVEIRWWIIDVAELLVNKLDGPDWETNGQQAALEVVVRESHQYLEELPLDGTEDFYIKYNEIEQAYRKAQGRLLDGWQTFLGMPRAQFEELPYFVAIFLREERGEPVFTLNLVEPVAGNLFHVRIKGEDTPFLIHNQDYYPRDIEKRFG